MKFNYLNIIEMKEDEYGKLAKYYNVFKNHVSSKQNIVLYYNTLRNNMLTQHEISNAGTSSRNKILTLGVSIFSFPLFYFIFKNIAATEEFKLQLTTFFSGLPLSFFIYKYTCEHISLLKLKKIMHHIYHKYRQEEPTLLENEE